MYTKQALWGLGIAGAGMTSEQAKQLDEIGYFILSEMALKVSSDKSAVNRFLKDHLPAPWSCHCHEVNAVLTRPQGGVRLLRKVLYMNDLSSSGTPIRQCFRHSFLQHWITSRSPNGHMKSLLNVD